jgi:membrane protein
MAEATQGMRERLWDLWESGRSSKSADLAIQAVRRDMRSGGELLASALAMRLFLLLLPFTAAQLALVGLVTNANPDSAVSTLKSVGITSAAASSVTESSRLSTTSLWLVLIGSLFALVLSARTTLRALWTIHALAWSEAPGRPPRPWLGAVTVIGCILAMLGLYLLTPVMQHAFGLGLGVVALLIAIAISTALWLAIMWLLPHGAAPWQALIPGALVTAVGTAVMHAVATLFLVTAVSHYSAAYGALGGAVAMLLWFYAVGRIIVAAAMLNAARWERRATG